MCQTCGKVPVQPTQGGECDVCFWQRKERELAAKVGDRSAETDTRQVCSYCGQLEHCMVLPRRTHDGTRLSDLHYCADCTADLLRLQRESLGARSDWGMGQTFCHAEMMTSHKCRHFPLLRLSDLQRRALLMRDVYLLIRAKGVTFDIDRTDTPADADPQFYAPVVRAWLAEVIKARQDDEGPGRAA
jgi:hypothetical protein